MNNCIKKVNKLGVLLFALSAFMMKDPELSLAADRDIVVLYTNDVHCGVNDNIGYAGLAQYENEIRKTTPYVTLVDAGDAIQGAPIGTLSDGKYLIDIMNYVGYDVAVPGNHEFDYGMSRFLELASALDCGYVSSNFMNLPDESLVFAPYKLIAYGDTQVAYVGVSTPESFTKSTPAYFQDENGNYRYGFGEDESGERLYSYVQSAVDAARAEGAEYVVLVAHLGASNVTERWSSVNAIKNTTGIDVCIDGHSHETQASKSVMSKDSKPVLLTQTGTKLNAIGKLVIGTDGSLSTGLVDEVPGSDAKTSYTVAAGDSLSRIAKRELGSYLRWDEIYQLNKGSIKNPDAITAGMILMLPSGCIQTESGRFVDSRTERFIRGIEAQYEESLSTVLGTTDYKLTVNAPESDTRAVRSAETNLGDFTADAYRYMLGAEIGLSNGGGIRSSINPGSITYKDALNVFPYGNMASVVEVSGQQIKDALEMASRNYPEECGGFLQVSGISYSIHPEIPSSVITDEKGNFVKVQGGYRVSDILIGGQPLEDSRIYTVASHDYLLKYGGDGMTMFQNSKVIKDAVMVDVDVLAGYLNTYLGGRVSSGYENPAGQGRIER